jgi:uncharacterized protein (TIGR02145 family)
MKKLLLALLATLAISACKKQMSNETTLESNTIGAKKVKPEKINVCHYDKTTDSWHTISINASSWPAHEQQGDLKGNCSDVIVKICGQTWMRRNLDVDHYRNGDPIPDATYRELWNVYDTTGIGASYNPGFIYWNNRYDVQYVDTFGKLYNQAAINDPRGLAPPGWHIPSRAEWQTIQNCLGFPSGIAMKSSTGWLFPDWNGTNSSGFTGLPGGYFYAFSIFYSDGQLFIADTWSGTAEEGDWWTTTLSEFGTPYIERLDQNSILSEWYFNDPLYAQFLGLSVRCIKD